MLHHILRSHGRAAPVARSDARLERNCRSVSELKRHRPRAKLRTEASRGMTRAPTFTASIRPALTSRLTVLSLTSPRSACVALIEISSRSSEKHLACRSFTGLTSRNDLPFSRVFSTGRLTKPVPACQVYVEDNTLNGEVHSLFVFNKLGIYTTSQTVTCSK